MKVKSKIIGNLVLAWLFVTVGTGLAQKTASAQDAFASFNLEPNVVIKVEPLSLKATDMRSLKTLSDAELEIFVNVLDTMPTISFDDLPLNERAGTYYSLQHPEWPPLPGNMIHAAVWRMENFYLLNDVTHDYQTPAIKSLQTGGQMRAMSFSGLPEFGEEESNSYEFSFAALVLTTNDLWLEITGTTNLVTTNGTVLLAIHPPWNVTNGVYDLFDTTNLAMPHGWNWIVRCLSGQTNLTVTNRSSSQDFFILGLTNDTDDDFLTDAYEKLVSGSSPTNTDTDADGWSDADEVLMGTNPTMSDLPHPSFSVATLVSPASEGGTNGQFLISRAVKFTNTVSVYYDVGGTTLNGDDYQYLSGEAVFAPGQTNATIAVTPVDDSDYEGNETVTLTLLPDFRYSIGSSSNASLTIADNDKPPVSVLANVPTATEGGTNYGVFTIQRAGNNASTLSVSFTLTGTATNGVQYTFVSTNVTLSTGSNSTSVIIAPVNNTNYFGARSVVLTLKTNTAYAVDGLASNAIITIGDDEKTSVQIIAADSDAREGSPVRDGKLKFIRSSSPAVSLTVNFVVHGTATAGSDYDDLPETVTIPAGTNAVTLTVHPIDDGASELRETVIAVLRGGSDYGIGVTNSATVFVDDNEPTTYDWEVVKASAVNTSGINLPAEIVIRRYGSTLTNYYVPLSFATNGSLSYPDFMSVADIDGDVIDNHINGAPAQNNSFWATFSNRISEAHIQLLHKTINGGAIDTRPYVNIFVTSLFGTVDYKTVYFHGNDRLFTLRFLTNIISEGSTGTVLRINRPASDGVNDLNINFFLAGVAKPATDYTLTNLYYPLTNSLQTNLTVTITKFAKQTDIPLRLIADNLTEGYESVYARLDLLSPYYSPDMRAGSNWMASLNIRDTNSVGTALPLDSDGDGMSDSFEKANGSDLNVFDDPYADSDGDGMSDVEESAAGTNPQARDSDGDGLDDYTEWTHGSDPMNPASNTLAAVGDYVRIKLSAASCFKCHQTTLNAGQYHLTSVPPIRGHTADTTLREQVFQFLKGASYPVSISGPVTSDTLGQYSADIEAVEDPPGFFVEDPQEMLGTALAVSNLASKTATLIVPKLLLGVDTDHDGTIRFDSSDQTAINQQYRFWVNDDNDQSEEENLNSTADYADLTISSKRDLEDFTRLAISVGDMAGRLQSNKLTLRLEWRSTNGPPAINLYSMADTNGSLSYLTDTNVATAQINSTNHTALVSLGTGTQFTFATNFWNNLGGGNATRTLLFEGAGEGSGQLVASLIRSNAVVAESPPVFLELKNIKKMYERATATPDDNNFPPPYNQPTSFPYTSQQRFQDSAADFQMDNSTAFEKPADETKQCVVFVHGWNMEYSEYLGFSETMFKRLWWQGFKGRFCAFRWATYTGFTTYNTSEFRAWKYGESLRRYGEDVKTRLGGYTFNLVAHSMGNVVVGSALNRGMTVDNYVLMQAAVPAGCYDTNASINSYAPFTNTVTPDWSGDRGYRGYLTNVTGNVVNFFNTNDFALATGTLGGLTHLPYLPFLWWIGVSWENNQALLKPDFFTVNFTFVKYKYNPAAVMDQRGRLLIGSYGYTNHYVTDPQEMMAFVARPRSQAVGAKKSVSGKIGGEVDLTGLFNFQGNRNEHSAEFNRSIQQLGEPNGFYKTLYDIIK